MITPLHPLRPAYDRFLPVSGVLFLMFGAALALAPFRMFGYLVKLLPWLLGASGALLAASALRKPPLRPAAMLSAAALPAAGIWLGFMAHYRDRALWYLAAGVLAWSAFRVLVSAFRSGAGLVRIPAALPALLFAGLMLYRPRSGFSSALTLFGVFALAWGTVLLTLPRRKS